MKIGYVSLICSVLMLLLVSSCKRDEMSSDVIAQNPIFSVSGNAVIQGNFRAEALSATHLVSNFEPEQQPDSKASVVKFKLAFNGHDNELQHGCYHYALAGKDTTTVIPGQANFAPALGTVSGYIDTLRVRVDLSAMELAFKKNGYFVTATGDTIFQKEFHGVWLAGDFKPLTWDFKNLRANPAFKLHRTSHDGIYEIKLGLSSQKTSSSYRHEWKAIVPNPEFPVINTGQTLIDALYNMSIEDIAKNRQKAYGTGYFNLQGSFNVNLSILLSLAYLDPPGAKKALRSAVENGRIRRDIRQEQAWPITGADLSWAMAAWEVFVVTGDRDWLRYAYSVIKNTVDEEYEPKHDQVSMLVHGAVRYPFADSQFYPYWMEAKDVYETCALTNNLLYERAFEILNDMSDELSEESDYGEMAFNLKEAVNESLWAENRGNYSPYTYMNAYPLRSPGIDNLGQALSVLWNVADDDRAELLIAKTPVSHFGVPLLAPRYSTTDEVNLGETVSPVLQALWNMAAAKVDNENMLRRGLGAMYRAQAMFCANRPACDAFTGNAIGTDNHDLGSACAGVAMVYRVFAGMTFLPNGIELNPFIPVFMAGTKRIMGFRYRNAVIDIIIDGTGNDIAAIEIDGKPGNDNFISAALTGRHSIHITMRDGKTDVAQQVTITKADFVIPPTPSVRWYADSAQVFNFDDNNSYRMVINGKLRYRVSDSLFAHVPDLARFTVNAMYGMGDYAFSYVSKPHYSIPAKCGTLLHVASNVPKLLPDSLLRFVELSGTATIDLPYRTDEAGTYFVDVRYANGSFSQVVPLFSLIANGHWQGTLLMPMRGYGEWLNVGWSNLLPVELLKGDNIISLERSQVRGNDARVLIEYIRIIKK